MRLLRPVHLQPLTLYGNWFRWIVVLMSVGFPFLMVLSGIKVMAGLSILSLASSCPNI